MKREPIGLYLHIPFCRSKCPYCDFCSYPRPTNELMESYTHELARRIREAGKTYGETRSDSVSHSGEGTTSRRLTLDTVYFGGGTKSEAKRA